LAKDYLYLCSKPGQTMIADDIRNHHLDRVLIAACSPRLHGKTFAQTAQRAGLNPYLLDMANIREHCSWVHIDGTEGTEKAFSIIKGGLGRLLYAEPLEPFHSPVTKRVLVIGGGIAGIQAALDIANSG
ncbi:MAG: disulfide reductase, partial [Deltaproteobacteria bacterium]|nr:disulfide reductase [Deltaproteobacteria bacterium]